MNDVTAFLLHGSTVVFTGALGLMIGLFVLELITTLLAGIGLGHAMDHLIGHASHPHVHVAHAHSPVASTGGILQLGRVPFIVWLTVVLTSFGVVGLIEQAASHEILGEFLSPWITAPLAGLLSLSIVHKVGKTIARWIPKEETSALSKNAFLGREATVLMGLATATDAAEARFLDAHQNAHYVMVHPMPGRPSIPAGSRVTLVRQLESGYFEALPLESTLSLPDVSADSLPMDLEVTASEVPSKRS